MSHRRLCGRLVTVAGCAVRFGGPSVTSGEDADAVEAVDLDHLVCTDEVEVLAASGFTSLRASDAKHFDVAAVAGDVITGSNVTGEGHLGPRNWLVALGHFDSLLSPKGVLQSQLELAEAAVEGGATRLHPRLGLSLLAPDGDV